jgi:hypothetical protein
MVVALLNSQRTLNMCKLELTTNVTPKKDMMTVLSARIAIQANRFSRQPRETRRCMQIP